MEKNLKATGLQPKILQNVTDKCSAHVRRSVKDIKYTKVYTNSWPIHRGHVVPDNFPVPECLVRFFTGVLLGDCTAVNLSLLSHTVLSALLILAVCRTRVTTNSVNMTSPATSLPVAQWYERPTRVTRGHGFDSRWGLRIFLCPTLVTN